MKGFIVVSVILILGCCSQGEEMSCELNENQFHSNHPLAINCVLLLVRSIMDFDDKLSDDANLSQLLSQPPIHKPFSYYQEYLNDGDADTPFTYIPGHEYGPSNWKKYYPSCGGDQQSPINVRTLKCVSHTFPKPLMYPDSDKQPTKVTIENNGYSIGWNLEYNGTRPHLTGGPLKSNYVFETMHMHWGHKKAGGSEHLLEGISADIELHLVHRNVKYASFNEAASHPDGLVVIGVLANAGVSTKTMQMFKNINDVREPFSSTVLNGRPKGYILRNLVGFVANEPFVTYRGSLTTPPCSEATLWLVAKNIRKISFEDVSK